MKTAPIKVRQMRRNDAAILVKMMHGLQTYHNDKCITTAKDFISNCLGSKKLATAWLVSYGDADCGFAISYDWMNFVRGYRVRHIDLLFIEEKFRKRGIGAALIHKIAQDAVKQGSGRVSLGVFRYNKPAIRFYQKLGFKQRDMKNSIHYQVAENNLMRLAKGAKGF